MCCILTGCRKEEKEPVTITLIHGWGSTENDHVAMRNIYREFEEENPDIRLQLISTPTQEEMIRKAEDMIMVGNMPDIVNFSGLGSNKTYDFIVENNMALNIMPYLEADEELKKDISNVNLEYWTTENNQLFTVSDVLSLSGGYWYNEEIFKQAGITEIPKTWEGFLDVCETLRTWSKRQNVEVQPLQPSAEACLYFMDHMLGDNAGKRQETIQSHQLVLEDEEFSKTIDCLKEIYSYSTSENVDYSYRDETSLFNEGKLAIYVNGVWGASMISEEINAKYALLPTASSVSMSCESTCLGYVLGNSGNKEKEEAAVRFLKYILSEEAQTRILEETEQIPANPGVSLEDYKKIKPRLYQAAALVLDAEKRIELPDNLWTAAQKESFAENILKVLTEGQSVQEFKEKLK